MPITSSSKRLKQPEKLTPIIRTTLTTDICRKMISHLLRGIWKEGEKIPAERELCQQLGVGRASLREALKALEIMGMIETRLGDGTYVCKRSDFLSRPLLWSITTYAETSTRELVEARMLIEGELASLAAERGSADDIAQIEKELTSMEAATKDSEAFVQADINFHLAIGRAASNMILMNALELIRNLLHVWVVSAIGADGVPSKACSQHRSVLSAIKKRDPALARKEMQKHLREMAAFMPKKVKLSVEM